MALEEGVPFREAYKQVGASIENGTFVPNKNINHTHQGSIGNLCNDMIVSKMEQTLKEFPFETIDEAINRLTSK